MVTVSNLKLVKTSRFERILLGSWEASENDAGAYYLPGLLLKGTAHLFFGATDTGKSWIAQYATQQSILEGKPVLYFDLENGPNVMAERLKDSLGLSKDEIDIFLHYYHQHDLSLDAESKGWFASLLSSFAEPGLIVFDSLLGHLSLCDLNEDSSVDFEKWVHFYLDNARALGWTIVVLDHSGHAGTHARGSSRKKQGVQVEFKVEKKEPFDRASQGRLKLTREKDRRALLPEHVEVVLGGSPFELKMKFDGQEFLTASTYKALHVLYMFGPSGATHKEWKDAAITTTTMSERTFNRAAKELKNKEYITQVEKQYFLTKKGESKLS